MKHLALFPLKDKSTKIKCCLLQFLFGPLRVTTKLGVLGYSCYSNADTFARVWSVM